MGQLVPNSSKNQSSTVTTDSTMFRTWQHADMGTVPSTTHPTHTTNKALLLLIYVCLLVCLISINYWTTVLAVCLFVSSFVCLLVSFFLCLFDSNKFMDNNSSCNNCFSPLLCEKSSATHRKC